MPPLPPPPQVQLQALIDAFFRDLQAANPDDQMQFNIAVSVMLIQRRWRTRMRAARLRNKKIWRALRRTGIPTYKVRNGLPRYLLAPEPSTAAATAPAGSHYAVSFLSPLSVRV